MIKFFRKIRQNLLSEGKTGKYFKYAIGEIVLVVIGILIALQINNWNENNKTRTYELKMLSEINNALENDIRHFNRMLYRLSKLDSSSTIFIQHIHDKSVFQDTLYRNGFSRWYGLRTGILYKYNPGPYEALKSSGLDKLFNDDLRNSLINFYDFGFPYNKEMVSSSDREYYADMAKLESFLSIPYTEKVNGKMEIYRKFPEDLFHNVEFLELLRNMRARARITTRHLNTHLARMKRVNDKIKAELNR